MGSIISPTPNVSKTSHVYCICLGRALTVSRKFLPLMPRHPDKHTLPLHRRVQEPHINTRADTTGKSTRFFNLRGNAAPVLASKLSVPDNLASGRENATFVFLCRNSDINGVVSSIQQMEDRFNKDYGYPWILLNEEPFTDEFKRYQKISVQISGTHQLYTGALAS